MDLAGTVVKMGQGEGCDDGRLQVGDAVWADGGGVGGDTGGMAQYAVVRCSQTGRAPKSINLTAAGTIPLVGFTSLECLALTGAPWSKANLTVVITSGTGGTGFIGVQLAKALGAARVVTATSGAANIALAKQLGADVVIDYKEQDIFDALPDDSVVRPGSPVKSLVRPLVLKRRGRTWCTIITAPKVAPIRRCERSGRGGVFLVLPGGNGGGVSKHPKKGVRQIDFGMAKASNHTYLDTIASLFDAGKLQPVLFAQIPLAQAARAFALSKTGTVVGKVAVVVS